MAVFERIMLIDDDEITNYINENILNDLDLGKEVISYIAAEEALNVIKEETEQPLTLILLDLKMPVFDGFDFLEEYNQLKSSIKKILNWWYSLQPKIPMIWRNWNNKATTMSSLNHSARKISMLYSRHKFLYLVNCFDLIFIPVIILIKGLCIQPRQNCNF